MKALVRLHWSHRLVGGIAGNTVLCANTIVRAYSYITTLRPDFTSKLVHELAFGTPKFYIAPYIKIKHELVNLSSNCDMKSGLNLLNLKLDLTGRTLWLRNIMSPPPPPPHHEGDILFLVWISDYVAYFLHSPLKGWMDFDQICTYTLLGGWKEL